MRFTLLLAMLFLLAGFTDSYSQTANHAATPANKNAIESHGPANGTLLVIGGAASDIFYEKF